MLSLAELHALFIGSAGVSIDTRTLRPRQLFFALRGDRFDGHNYVDQAIAKGADYCIVDKEEYQNRRKCIYFPNVLATLQRLARFHRDTFDISVLAITGSNGKTTTKELLHAVIRSKYNTLATEGNYNNHLGVPLTLLRLTAVHEFAIIEMGANRVGEIKWLCQIARPTHGLITNIGKAHLEGFGSLDNIRKAKSELYYYLDGKSGVIFHNGMEGSLNFVPDSFSCINSFNTDQLLGLKGKLTFSETGLYQCFQIGDDEKIATRMYGKFNRNNILAAIAIGSFFEISSKRISKSISDYQPLNNRSQLVEVHSNAFYLDAYNANPNSMMQALEFFKGVEQKSKIIILGDMLELGAAALEEHRKILQVAAMIPNIESILVVGQLFTNAAKENSDPKFIIFKNVEEAKVFFMKQDFRNRHILVKGSRGIELEKILA